MGKQRLSKRLSVPERRKVLAHSGIEDFGNDEPLHVWGGKIDSAHQEVSSP